VPANAAPPVQEAIDGDVLYAKLNKPNWSSTEELIVWLQRCDDQYDRHAMNFPAWAADVMR
jgi:hypothetical protein